MSGSMEQVILGSNQAAISGGSETASFYNPFQAFASKKFSQENSQAVSNEAAAPPAVEQPAAAVSENTNTLEGEEQSSQPPSEAPIIDQAIVINEEARVAGTATSEVVEEKNQLTANNESAAPVENNEMTAESNKELPTVNEEVNQQLPDATTSSEGDGEITESVIEYDLAVPFPSDEQMGQVLDLTPGSADIQGAVFSQEAQQQVDAKQQAQEIGGKQDVVGLLSHLTKGQDEQSGEKASPQICEIDQKTGAWLGEGCQDEPVVENSQAVPVEETSSPEQNLAKQAASPAEAKTLISEEQDTSESEQEMSTYAPTSGKIEIIDTNSNEMNSQVAAATETSTLSESEGDQVSESMATNVTSERQVLDSELLSAEADEFNAAELNASSLGDEQSEAGVSTEIKPLIDDDKQETFERALMNLADGEQSTEQALERIKQYYTEQLNHENQEGRLLQLLFDLEQVDKNLLNLKKQYQQIETLQRVWE